MVTLTLCIICSTYKSHRDECKLYNKGSKDERTNEVMFLMYNRQKYETLHMFVARILPAEVVRACLFKSNICVGIEH